METVTISLERYLQLEDKARELQEIRNLSNHPEYNFLEINAHPHVCLKGYAKKDIIPIIQESNKKWKELRDEMREMQKNMDTEEVRSWLSKIGIHFK